MRSELWAAAAVIVLTCTACSNETAKTPPAPVAQASAPAAAEATAPATMPESPAPAEETAAASSSPPVVAAPPAPPARVITVVPAKERRIRALLANAMARDPTGETEEVAAWAAAQRAGCKTQACVDRSYAAQEASLRKWVGSEDIH